MWMVVTANSDSWKLTLDSGFITFCRCDSASHSFLSFPCQFLFYPLQAFFMPQVPFTLSSLVVACVDLLFPQQFCLFVYNWCTTMIDFDFTVSSGQEFVVYIHSVRYVRVSQSSGEAVHCGLSHLWGTMGMLE